jgi:Xaa-Pro aminopeptidase
VLLIDAGCEVDCYASDITRTFPVNGRFSPEQLALYEIVLAANYAAIEKVKPGNHWNEPHEAAVRVITQGLMKLGLLKGKLAKLEESGAYRNISCIVPATGSAWTCTMSATTRSATSGACSNPAWR